jgi:hypothetical protein
VIFWLSSSNWKLHLEFMQSQFSSFSFYKGVILINALYSSKILPFVIPIPRLRVSSVFPTSQVRASFMLILSIVGN